MNDDEPMAQVVQELDVSDTLLTLKKMNKNSATEEQHNS